MKKLSGKNNKTFIHWLVLVCMALTSFPESARSMPAREEDFAANRTLLSRSPNGAVAGDLGGPHRIRQPNIYTQFNVSNEEPSFFKRHKTFIALLGGGVVVSAAIGLGTYFLAPLFAGCAAVASWPKKQCPANETTTSPSMEGATSGSTIRPPRKPIIPQQSLCPPGTEDTLMGGKCVLPSHPGPGVDTYCGPEGLWHQCNSLCPPKKIFQGILSNNYPCDFSKGSESIPGGTRYCLPDGRWLLCLDESPSPQPKASSTTTTTKRAPFIPPTIPPKKFETGCPSGEKMGGIYAGGFWCENPDRRTQFPDGTVTVCGADRKLHTCEPLYPQPAPRTPEPQPWPPATAPSPGGGCPSGTQMGELYNGNYRDTYNFCNESGKTVKLQHDLVIVCDSSSQDFRYKKYRTCEHVISANGGCPLGTQRGAVYNGDYHDVYSTCNNPGKAVLLPCKQLTISCLWDNGTLRFLRCDKVGYRQPDPHTQPPRTKPLVTNAPPARGGCPAGSVRGARFFLETRPCNSGDVLIAYDAFGRQIGWSCGDKVCFENKWYWCDKQGGGRPTQAPYRPQTQPPVRTPWNRPPVIDDSSAQGFEIRWTCSETDFLDKGKMWPCSSIPQECTREVQESINYIQKYVSGHNSGQNFQDLSIAFAKTLWATEGNGVQGWGNLGNVNPSYFAPGSAITFSCTPDHKSPIPATIVHEIWHTWGQNHLSGGGSLMCPSLCASDLPGSLYKRDAEWLRAKGFFLRPLQART